RHAALNAAAIVPDPSYPGGLSWLGRWSRMLYRRRRRGCLINRAIANPPRLVSGKRAFEPTATGKMWRLRDKLTLSAAAQRRAKDRNGSRLVSMLERCYRAAPLGLAR